MLSKQCDVNADTHMDNREVTELKKRRKDSRRLSFLLILENFLTYNDKKNEKGSERLS